ncbi:MAG TPA: polyhydroxyalkanoic acid system family protein [Thermoanaerobaculia bacterium]|nr:polyhydroxyalkanoic acid system family protein [Thermoanaerobaculia bacterium]
MHIVIRHHSTPDEAKVRVEHLLHELMERDGDRVAAPQHRWVGDALLFSFRTKGFEIKGKLEVTEHDLILDGKLPFLALPFESKIRSRIEQEAERIFS